MLHCVNSSGNMAGDMTVLERQRARMKLEEEQGYFSGFNDSMMLAADSGSALAEVVTQARSINNPTAQAFDATSSLSRTFSCPPTLVDPESKPKPKPKLKLKLTDSSIGKESFKKRKSDNPDNPKVCGLLHREKEKRTCCALVLL